MSTAISMCETTDDAEGKGDVLADLSEGVPVTGVEIFFHVDSALVIVEA
jgi:hypothetical protein